MKRNPVSHYIRRVVRAYASLLGKYGERAKLPLKNIENVTVWNEAYLKGHYLRLSEDLGNKTRSFIVEAVDEVVQATITIYNDIHNKNGGEPLDQQRIAELRVRILKDFLLTKFKNRTLDDRVNNATLRLQANILPLLNNYATATTAGSKVSSTMEEYFKGNNPIPGGTALRWNSRLIVSELYRAYQYTAKEVLIELGVNRVSWVNSLKHKKPNITDEYAANTYTPRQIPPYPHPCNESFFIPIYKED